jgi:uncharacterized protein (TIGR02466 family)
MADRMPPSGASGAAPLPQLTMLKLFPTLVVGVTMPDAEPLNAELKRLILEREAATETVERSNRGGWQSSWDMQEWGGAPMQRLLAFAKSVVDEITVDRTGQHRRFAWRINCWANINRSGHANQFHTHPGAVWSASYYVDDGGISADASLGGEFEILDPRGVAPIMNTPQLTFPGPEGLSLGESERIKPKAGMLIVFPAWLSHGVCPYHGNGVRISIAMNFSVVAGIA